MPKPVSRHGVSKGRSAAQFRRKVSTANLANYVSPRRGGIRM